MHRIYLVCKHYYHTGIWSCYPIYSAWLNYQCNINYSYKVLVLIGSNVQHVNFAVHLAIDVKSTTEKHSANRTVNWITVVVHLIRSVASCLWCVCKHPALPKQCSVLAHQSALEITALPIEKAYAQSELNFASIKTYNYFRFCPLTYK